MLKASITVEDCYMASVDITKIDKYGITYHVFDCDFCYPCQSEYPEGPQFLSWKTTDYWYINSIEEYPEYDALLYNLIVLLAEAKSEDVEDKEFKEYVCKEAMMTEETYDSLINDDRGIPYELYEQVVDYIDDSVNVDSVDGKRKITRALGYYLENLADSYEDRHSDDPRRQYYATTEEDCLNEAIKKVLN